jgi:hypothetical protein
MNKTARRTVAVTAKLILDPNLLPGALAVILSGFGKLKLTIAPWPHGLNSYCSLISALGFEFIAGIFNSE